MLGGYVYWLLSVAQHHAPAGSFASLVDHKGRVFSTEPQAHEFKLVVFGYTHCPDVCPITLLKLREVLNALGSEDRRIVPLFVTVDPVHDTGEVLAQYTAAFDSRIIGITGTKHDLRAFAEAYALMPQESASTGHEDMPVHSAMIYLLGPDNATLGVYGPADATRAIAADILRRTGRMASAVTVGGERT